MTRRPSSTSSPSATRSRGPGSTQLAFSIAVVKHGILSGLLAFPFWSLPRAVGMADLAVGVSRIPDMLPPIVLALLTGLNAAAVGLIAFAAVQLAKNAGTDRITVLLLWLSASFGVCYHAPWMYPTLIATGGLSALVWDFRRQWILQPIRRALRKTRHEHRRASSRHEQVELRDMSNTTGPSRPASSDTSPGSPVENKSAPASICPPSTPTSINTASPPTGCANGHPLPTSSPPRLSCLPSRTTSWSYRSALPSPC
jgi:chromate transport protein ChrA